MLNVGRFQTSTCHSIGRRHFLQLGSSAALGMSAATSLRAGEVIAPVRAKSVIFVFLWGAPSHLDTCDPKPDAPLEYRGPFGVIPTRTPGVHFTELIPEIARRSDRFSLVRTHTTTAMQQPN